MRTNSTRSEPIFVCGSDLDGTHTSDSAAFAVRFHQAEVGVWSGLSGNAYVIPYLDSQGTILPLSVIKNYVDPMLKFAKEHTDRLFRVARFGSGQQAHDDTDMAKLFANSPANCQLPGVWSRINEKSLPSRLLVFDPGGHLQHNSWQEKLGEYLSLNAPLWDTPSVEMVTVGSARAIVGNDKASRALSLKHRVIAANESYYGKHAALAAEYHAVWYATHVLSILDFNQTAQPDQMRVMRTAARNGLNVDQLDLSAA